MNHLPHRLTEKNFRIYEPVITCAINNTPARIILSPAPLSPTTYADRLRGAMQSYADFEWASAINPDQFHALRDGKMLQVVHDAEGLSFGGNGALIHYTPDSFTRELSELICSVHSDSVYRAIVVLKLNGVLLTPIRIISPPDLDSLTTGLTNAGIAFDIRNSDVLIL